MKISRRNILAGMALTGVLAPVGYYAARQYKAYRDKDLTPDAPQVELADAKLQHLNGQLRGIWDVKVEGMPALEGLPADNVQMLFDVAERGRGISGFVDTADNLRLYAEPRYRVLGDMVGASVTQIRWRLLDRESPRRVPAYEFTAQLDEQWAAFGVADADVLKGTVHTLDHERHTAGVVATFEARKQPFPLSRERMPVAPELLAWGITPQKRLEHQLWHFSRDKWHLLSDERQEALRALGWQPGPRNAERGARGRTKDHNGSGEDFFFMHRYMLTAARKLQDLPSWRHFPVPPPAAVQDWVGFTRFYDNHGGCCVPPTWNIPDDEGYSTGMGLVKSPETFYSNFQVWESRYRDHAYLSKMTLSQLGSELELSLHDWLHMCWSSVPRNPATNEPVPAARYPSDFAEHWFARENDFLGDPFSSHLNPTFWRLHGWIDDRVEDWFDAHERAHPGQVVRREVRGVQWFAVGPWVKVDEPWLGSTTHGCGDEVSTSNEASAMEIETMKLALHIAADDKEHLGDSVSRAPHRPYYARSLPTGKV